MSIDYAQEYSEKHKDTETKHILNIQSYTSLVTNKYLLGSLVVLVLFKNFYFISKEHIGSLVIGLVVLITVLVIIFLYLLR